MPRTQAFYPRLTTLLLGSAALGLIASIIAFPSEAFRASLQGLQLWWKLVFPALLPFLIITEMMRGLGVLHGLGALCEPLLRLLLRLPGVSGWVLAVGMTAGTPAGAAAIGPLCQDGVLRRTEAERLLAASHVMSPVFLIGVVGVGFLQSPTMGLALAVIHYASALAMALIHRLTGAPAGPSSAAPLAGPGGGPWPWLQQAFAAYEAAKARDGRTFGKLLGDSVSAGVQQLFIVGGCMMMFSVLLHALSLTGAARGVSAAAAFLTGADPALTLTLVNAVFASLLEPHLGAHALAGAASAVDPAAAGSLPYALFSLLLAWGGLSTHAQVKSLTAGSGLRYSRFLLARLQHGTVAFLAALLAWEPLMNLLGGAAPAFAHSTALGAWEWSLERGSLWPLVSPLMLQFGTGLLLTLLLSIAAAFVFYRGRSMR